MALEYKMKQGEGVLPRECLIANAIFQQHKKWLYTWYSQMVNTEIILFIFFAAKDGEALYSQQKQKQDDCGSDHEILIAVFRLKFKKVGKSTRTFMYDLN